MNGKTREYIWEAASENDIFEDVLNKTNHNTTIGLGEKYFIISEFVELISNLVNVSAYLFLGITILRFKRLKTRKNTYILHLSLLYGFFTLSKMICNILFSLSTEKGLALEQASTSFLLLYLLICLILGLDWIISGYQPNLTQKYEKVYKYFLAVLYGIVITEYLVTFVYAYKHHLIRIGISRFFYGLIIIFMIALNAMKFFFTLSSQCVKSVYALNVSNIIIFSLAPMFICHCILWINYSDILVYISIIPEIFWCNHPIVVVYVLGVQNKLFKLAYMKSFKKSVQSYDEDFVDESEDFTPTENSCKNAVE